MSIILIGMKACGKSTVGKLLAINLNIGFIELDQEIEKAHSVNKKEVLSFKEIFKKYGAVYFRKLESKTLKNIFQEKKSIKFVLSCGGGTPLNSDNQLLLHKLGKIFFLNTNGGILLPRIIKNGVPAFFPYPNNPKKSLDELLEKRRPIYEKIADKTISFVEERPEEIVKKIINLLK
ncbi:MAG: shikimate kinase [Patescibacteria group bacterium]